MKHLSGIAALLLLTCTGVPDVPEPYGPKLTYRKGTVQAFQLDGLNQIRRIPERCFQRPGATPDRVTFLNGRMLPPGGHAGLPVEEEQKSKH